jgi:hypothetical protein
MLAMTTGLTKKVLPTFAFWDFCVRALPGSLSLEMMKPEMGLTSSLAPLFPTPCDHLSEHMLTPDGATRTRLSRFLLQGTLVPSIPETRKPGIIRIYGPDCRLDQWTQIKSQHSTFRDFGGVFTPISPISRTPMALDLRHASSTNGRSRFFRDSSFLPHDPVLWPRAHP